MATVAEKKKLRSAGLSQAAMQRIVEANKKYHKKFEGTIEEPYELTTTPYNKTTQLRPNEDQIIENMTTLDEYFKSNRSNVTYKNRPVVLLSKSKRESSRESYRVALPGYSSWNFYIGIIGKNGEVSVTTEIFNHSITSHMRNHLRSKSHLGSLIIFEPGFIADNIGLIRNKQLILNADEGDLQLVGSPGFEKYPALSFECLANVLANEVVRPRSKSLEILFKSKFEVIDFNEEIKIKCSESIRKEAIRENKNNHTFTIWKSSIKPPKPGLTLIYEGSGEYVWHKSPTVLLRSGKHSYILGQDEGTYFGCILTDNPESVEDAFVSLMPKEARGVLGVLRQGEWFAIPVNEKEVPGEFGSPDLVASAQSHGGIFLPKDDKDSNLHCLSGTSRFAKNGRLYVQDFTLEHDQHEAMKGAKDQWYFFAKNTAIASYSAENVD